MAETAAVAVALGGWPFATPLLEMRPDSDEWVTAVHVLNRAWQLRWPVVKES